MYCSNDEQAGPGRTNLRKIFLAPGMGIKKPDECRVFVHVVIIQGDTFVILSLSKDCRSRLRQAQSDIVLLHHKCFTNYFAGPADYHGVHAFAKAAGVQPDNACLVLQVLCH